MEVILSICLLTAVPAGEHCEPGVADQVIKFEAPAARTPHACLVAGIQRFEQEKQRLDDKERSFEITCVAGQPT